MQKVHVSSGGAVARNLKILAVHGVGRHRFGGGWTDRWTRAIEQSLARVNPDVGFEVEFVSYDNIFDTQEITTLGTLEAIGKLAGSGIWHVAGDALGTVFGRHPRRARGLRSISDKVRWTAGMVIQWIENEAIRRESRRLLANRIKEYEPDVVCAHSLGSLIAYDTFSRSGGSGLMQGRTFISFGSQIGNPFIRSQFAGRIEAIDCLHWYHLYNPEDDIFTTPIRISATNFEQVNCFFDISGFADHDAAEYLANSNMSDIVWDDLLSTRRIRTKSRKARALIRTGGAHGRRALLIGINEYPAADMRLEGCVNDVFLMSELLQEYGFDASEIRIVLDHRATAEAMRQRIEWLLDGAQADNERILFFSGHGAQIADYGADETIDRVDECLVPWDFDWSRHRAVTDDWFHELYSQLPYEARFLAIIDCCHSGGMTRSGLGRPRGLTPPDDIRHRQLKWDVRLKAWKERRPKVPNVSLLEGKGGTDYLGKSGVNRRLGRATDLRVLDNKTYDRERKHLSHHGPYLPVLLQACQEDELAFEYRHGTTAYGAFTYTLAQELRRSAVDRTNFSTLIRRVRSRLRTLGYDQTPSLVGPHKIISRPIK